jgi:SnoaL-like domain
LFAGDDPWTAIAARHAIYDTLVRYFVGLDTRQLDLVSSCFTEDVEAIYAGERVAGGRAALMEFLSGGRPLKSVDLVDRKRSTHMIGNVSYDIHGQSACVETGCLAHLIDAPEGRLRMRTRGLRYRDDFRLERGEWRIARREHICDWTRLDSITNVS